MADDIKNQTQYDDKKKPLPPEGPPHIFHELMDLKEKVGKLEGQMDVLLRLKDK